MTQSPSSEKKSFDYLPVGKLSSYTYLFRSNKQFTRLWTASIISQLGNWFNYIAIFVMLTKLTGSGQAVSWFLIAKFIPTTIFGPAAGVFADRFSRKTIMITCDVLRIFIVLGFLLVKKPEHVWIVYTLALIQESVWSFYDPARRASIPNLCKPEELNLANALGGATWSLMLAIGAALGGFVTALLGWEAAIIIDACTFIISAFILRKLVLPHPAAPKIIYPTWKDFTGLNEMIEGSKYIAGHRNVGALMLVKSGWALSGGVLVLLTYFGEQVFSQEATGRGSGILYSVRGVGAAIGPLLAWRLLGETRHAMYRAIGLSFFVAAGSYLLFSKAPSLLWAAPFVFAGHLGGSVQWVFSTNLLQRMVPDQFRGRVFAAEMALLTLILSLSTYFTGMALDTGMDPRLVASRLALLFIVPGTMWTIYVFATRLWLKDQSIST
jgi:MFS family permease